MGIGRHFARSQGASSPGPRTIEERFKLSAGQAVLFEPRDPHYTINEGEEESVYLVITVKQ